MPIPLQNFRDIIQLQQSHKTIAKLCSSTPLNPAQYPFTGCLASHRLHIVGLQDDTSTSQFVDAWGQHRAVVVSNIGVPLWGGGGGRGGRSCIGGNRESQKVVEDTVCAFGGDTVGRRQIDINGDF